MKERNTWVAFKIHLNHSYEKCLDRWKTFSVFVQNFLGRMQVWAGIDNHSPRARLQPGAHALTMPCGRSCSVYACPTLLGSYRRRVPCSKRPRLLVHCVPNFINFHAKSSSDMLRSCEALYPSSTSHPMSWQSRLLGHKIGRVSEQISRKTGGCTKPWYSSPKDIHYNQESVFLVVLGVTNQYSFVEPSLNMLSVCGR